jgi:hypothetical protein
MSACVKWAKEHVESFNAILTRQLSSVDRQGDVWSECMELAQEHAGMLRDVGLDLSEMVGCEEGVEREREREVVGLGVS